MSEDRIFQLINQQTELDVLTEVYQLKNIDIDVRNNQGQTPLHLAVLKNMPEIAAYFLSLGANPNAKDHMGLSPFIAAAANGFSEMFDLICQYNPEVTQTNRFGGTALLPSSEKGFLRVVQLAIEADVPVNHVNKLGWSALLEAVVLGDEGFLYRDIILELLSANADKMIQDFDGKTAIDYAIEQEKHDMLNILNVGENTQSPFYNIRALLRQGNYLQTIKDLLSMESTLERVYYLGYVYELLGKFNISQFYYQLGLKESVEFAYYLANSYKKEKNYSKTLDYFDLGIKESKRPEFFLYHKSNFLREIGEHEAAIEVMDALLEKEPLRVDYLFHKSNSFISLGQYDLAYKVMAHAHDIQPSNSLFVDQLEQLEGLIIKEA